MRRTDLTAVYFERFFELGGTCNFLDPVGQSMPERIADGPWSTNGDVPFALVTADHLVRHGDVIWTDTVSGYEGYASDVGRTWVVGRPSRTLVEVIQKNRELVGAPKFDEREKAFARATQKDLKPAPEMALSERVEPLPERDTRFRE